MSSLSGKRPKNNPINSKNYINKLPDGVLSHILSRVPLTDAVRTCVLSKEWEFKWTLKYNVHISSSALSLEYRRGAKFVNIVERVVHHLHHIEKFGLFCVCGGEDELSRIATLLSGILRRNVKHLQFEIFGNQDFVLPRSLSSCTSLIEWYMHFETLCSFKVPVRSGFPNLKSLYLEGVKIINEVSITDTIFFNFPVLKELELEECRWINVKCVEIYAPSLCKFSSRTRTDWDDKKDLDYSIKVHGAKLDELITDGGYPENIVMFGSTVACANLDCMVDCSPLSLGERGLLFRKLLRGICNMKHLIVTDVLPAIGSTKLGLPLLPFFELKRLHVDQLYDAEGLLELLYAAPFLTFLEIVSDMDEYDYDSVEYVPYCVTHQLKIVKMYYQESSKPNYRVEKFLLKNGALLKTVRIEACVGKLPESNMVEKFSTFPTASRCLKIHCPSSM